MKELVLFATLILCAKKGLAQDLRRIEHDTLFSKSGYNVAEGMLVRLGTGSNTVDGSFIYVKRNEDGLSEYTLGSHKEYEKGGEHWHWAGGYENGYLNKYGQRFKKVSELKNNRRQAWTTNNSHVLLNRNGQINKNYDN